MEVFHVLVGSKSKDPIRSHRCRPSAKGPMAGCQQKTEKEKNPKAFRECEVWDTELGLRKRWQRSWPRDSHGGCHLLSTYQVSDSGVSAFLITLFNHPLQYKCYCPLLQIRNESP